MDNGHQPWRLSVLGVSSAYAEAVLLPGPEQATVRRTSPHTVAVLVGFAGEEANSVRP